MKRISLSREGYDDITFCYRLLPTVTDCYSCYSLLRSVTYCYTLLPILCTWVCANVSIETLLLNVTEFFMCYRKQQCKPIEYMRVTNVTDCNTLLHSVTQHERTQFALPWDPNDSSRTLLSFCYSMLHCVTQRDTAHWGQPVTQKPKNHMLPNVTDLMFVTHPIVCYKM